MLSLAIEPLVVGGGMAQWQEQEAGLIGLHFRTGNRMKEEVGRDYKLSKPTPGDVLPPAMFHLRKVP